jgi:hypothetical protein
VQPSEVTDVLNRPISQELLAREWEAEVRSLYDGMVRIVVTPRWAKLIDFETTLPSAVAELARQRDERQRA